MTEQIDRVGVYRGRLVEHGMKKSKNGYPTFVARLVADELFDDLGDPTIGGTDGEPGWVPWGYEQEIVGFLTLVGKDGATFHVENLMGALGWDGSSFLGLAEGDWSNRPVLFRVEENDYDGKVSLQVRAIEAHDADPRGRGLSSMDAAGLRDLDAKFAGILKPAKKAAPKRVEAPPAKPEPAKKAATPAAPAKKKAGAGPTIASKEDAWNALFKTRPEGVDDDAVTTAFLDAVDEVAPDKDDDTITPTEWAKVYALASKTVTESVTA